METNHQLRILYLYQILLRYSDPDHPVSTKELLNSSGLEVMEIRSREKKYYLNDRLFELPEVKLLIDAVQSSKFISAGKSQELISKLMTLTSVSNAAKLKRNLYVTGRVKSNNEKTYYIVEAINEAINSGRRISFCYTDFNVHKERVLKNDGLPYILSPYALVWDGDFYYVLGLNHARDQLNTFRVDRISRQPDILDDAAAPTPENFNLSDYSQEVCFQTANVEQLFFFLHPLFLPFPFVLLALADAGHNPFFPLQSDPALNRSTAFFAVDQAIITEVLS